MANRDIRRIFFLTDKEGSTVKYLFALACGIPCISVDILKEVDANVSPAPDRDAKSNYFERALITGTSTFCQRVCHTG